MRPSLHYGWAPATALPPRSIDMGGTIFTEGVTVYACVTNNYDRLQEADALSRGVQFICFSNRPVKKTAGWDMRYLASPPRLCSGHDINRYHKVFSNRILSDYRYSIYVDGNIRYRGDLHVLVRVLERSGAALGVFRHPAGRRLAEEVEACRRHRKFDHHDESRVHEQIETYTDQGFELSTLVSANYLIVRDHSHPLLSDAMSLWWSQLFEFTKRDQLSLNYVLWKTGLPWVFLDDSPEIRAEDVIRVAHYRPLWRRVIERAKKLAGQ